MKKSKSFLWTVGDTTFEVERLPSKCPACGKRQLTGIPAVLAGEDGTNVVCHPTFGGCNSGFKTDAPPRVFAISGVDRE